MATVSCPGTGKVQVPCCNEDDGNPCKGECFDANCDDCECSAAVHPVDVDEDHVRLVAEKSGVDVDQVEKAYRARKEIMAETEPARLNATVVDGRVESLRLADERGGAGTTVSVRQPALYGILNAETHGEAFREATAAKRSGDLTVEHESLVGSLAFGVASVAYGIGSTLGLVPDAATASGGLG